MALVLPRLPRQRAEARLTVLAGIGWQARPAARKALLRGIVGRLAWREVPWSEPSPSGQTPPARESGDAHGIRLRYCQRRYRCQADRSPVERRKMPGSQTKTTRSMPMSDTPSTLPKPKKSVALSGTAAGNTALCTIGRSGNDLHSRRYDIQSEEHRLGKKL